MRGGLRGVLPAVKAYGWVSQPDYGEKVGDNRSGPVPEVTPGGRALEFVQGNRGGLMVI